MDALNKADLLIAIEGGGTRSQAALLSLDGQVLALAPGGDVNTNFTSFAQAQASVLAAVQNALTTAGCSGEAVTHIARALVGPPFGAETFGSLCPRACYHDYSECDVVFARAGLDARRAQGVALVAGTGATAFARRADDGRSLALGGWGSLLGDEGSAYALGLLALRAAARAVEGRAGLPTRLVSALAEHFSIPLEHFKHGLIQVAYGQVDKNGRQIQAGLTRAQVGALAPLATTLADQGDPLAGTLVDKVGRDLAELGLHAARRLFTAEERFDVALAGGLVNAGERFLAPLRAGLGAEFPRAMLHTGQTDPAVALGQQTLRDLAKNTL